MGELLVVLLLIPPRGAEKLTQLSMSKPNANVGLWQLVGWAATVLGSCIHLNQAPGGFPLNLTTPFFFFLSQQNGRWSNAKTISVSRL